MLPILGDALRDDGGCVWWCRCSACWMWWTAGSSEQPWRRFYSPGNAQYEATLAGRLRNLLLADADLSAKFGWDYRVRACGFAGQTLASLTPTIPADSVKPSAPSAMGVHSKGCANDPAAIVVLFATGKTMAVTAAGVGLPYADDKATFADHMATRIGAFVATRKPALLLLGPGQSGIRIAPTAAFSQGSRSGGVCLEAGRLG